MTAMEYLVAQLSRAIQEETRLGEVRDPDDRTVPVAATLRASANTCLCSAKIAYKYDNYERVVLHQRRAAELYRQAATALT